MSVPHPYWLPSKRSPFSLMSSTATGLALLLSISGPSPANAGAQPRQHDVSSIAQRSTARSLSYQFTPGTRLRYTVVYQTESISDFSTAVKAPRPKSGSAPPMRTIVMSPLAHSFKTYLGGELVITVLDKRDAGFLIAYSLRDPVVKLEAQGQGDEAHVDKVRSDLTRPVFGLVSPQGRILSLRLDPSLHSISRNFVKATLATTEFVLPADDKPASVRSWEAEEEDGNGDYVASYDEASNRRLTNSSSRAENPIRTFRKTRVRDLSPANSGNKNGVYEIAPAISASGGFRAQIDTSHGRLLSVTGAETQEFSLAGHVIGATKSTLRYRLFKTETLTATEQSELRRASIVRERVAEATGLRARAPEGETETALQRANLGSATLESLLAALDSTKSTSDAGDTQLYLRFRALVYLHPDKCVKLGQILATDVQERAAKILIDALASIGHEQAQAALVTAIKAHPDDNVILTKLLLGLSRSVTLSQLTKDTLREISTSSHMPEIAELALYLLNKAR